MPIIVGRYVQLVDVFCEFALLHAYTIFGAEFMIRAVMIKLGRDSINIYEWADRTKRCHGMPLRPARDF